jgi:RNA polymerase sigma-70 factor (ECF subfamily)
VLKNDADAEDALQEAYVRAFAALPAFREEAQVRTWLTRILLNEARGRLRRRRPTADLAEVEWAQADGARVLVFPGAPPLADPERRAAMTEARKLLERAVDELPTPFRLVFVLREIEGLSNEDTATALGLRPETVKTRLHRARRLLRQALDDELASALHDGFPFLGARCARIRTAVLTRLTG